MSSSLCNYLGIARHLYPECILTVSWLYPLQTACTLESISVQVAFLTLGGTSDIYYSATLRFVTIHGIYYRRSPHFVIFGTKRVSRNSGIMNFETLFSAKSQIGPKNFLKSTFLAIFSVFKSQNTIYYQVFSDIFLSSKLKKLIQ